MELKYNNNKDIKLTRRIKLEINQIHLHHHQNQHHHHHNK